jgi:hypothetical protein
MADEVFEKLILANELTIVNSQFLSLTKNDSLATGLPDYFQDYLRSTSQLPSWYDPQKIKIAEDLYSLYGLEISMMLLFKSLPQSYCCAKGAKVLSSTGRLSKEQQSFNKYSRRIMETSYFVMQVLSPKAFADSGSAIITTQKTRLIHASIRYYIKKYGWDSATNGEPINQQDMIGTLMSFSALIIEGLEMLNIKWTEKQQDAFIHCWNVIGYILGVKEELLPANYKEAMDIGYRVFNDQKAASQEGKELADALVSFIQHIIPGTSFDSIPNEMIHFFLGEENATLLGVKREKNGLQDSLPGLFKFAWGISDELKDHSAIVRAIAKPFSKMVLQGVLFSYSNNRGLSLLIPPSLKDNWEMHTGWINSIVWPSILGRRIVIQRKITTT